MTQNEQQSPQTKSDETLEEKNGEQSKEDLLRLEVAHNFLFGFNVVPEQLCLIFLGSGEVIFGEVQDEVAEFSLRDSFVSVTNPKRFRRHDQMGNGGYKTIFFATDLDLITGGTIYVKPVGIAKFSSLNTESQINYCETYLMFLKQRDEMRILAKAQEAGLVTPNDLAPNRRQ